MSLHYNSDNCFFFFFFFFVNEKEIYKFNASNKNVTFPSQFCLGSVSEEVVSEEVHSEEVSSKGNLYDFSVDYGSIGKCNILNIHKYLVTKNNIK